MTTTSRLDSQAGMRDTGVVGTELSGGSANPANPSTVAPDVAGKLLSSRVYPEFFPLAAHWTVLNLGCGNAPQAVVYRGAFRWMVGVDIQEKRLRGSRATCRAAQVTNFQPLRADAEMLPLRDACFDAVLAIDVIEHLRHPERMLDDVARVLRPGGRMLVTFPAAHDHFRDATSFVVRRVLRLRPRREEESSAWHPDKHQEDRAVDAWLAMLHARFRVVERRATTLFPPLHLYGVPRVWFRWDWLHALDRAVCRIPQLQRLGQAIMCVCEVR
jgi:SAM-dependent methyltransferase